MVSVIFVDEKGPKPISPDAFRSDYTNECIFYQCIDKYENSDNQILSVYC